MRSLRPRERSRLAGGEEGFSLIELLAAMTIAAFVFVALGAALGGGLKALAVQKARTRGNQVATQGLEAIQRLKYTDIGVCTAPPNPPSGLDVQAAPLNCPNPVPAGYGEDPCNATTSGAGTPKSVYSCVQNGITYNVRRYVAWGDPGQTWKRVAVFVNWTDPTGSHEASQQSAVRAPGQSDIAGLAPPKVTSASVNGGTTEVSIKDLDGTLVSSVPLAANTANLVTGDKVFAIFTVIDANGNPATRSKFLTLNSANYWTGSIDTADNFKFGAGSQFIVFSAIRAADGKSNSMTSDAVRFCKQSDAGCANIAGVLPEFSGTPTVTPSSGASDIKVTSSGGLVDDKLDLAATTTNTTTKDAVAVTFDTASGAVTVLLKVGSCSLLNTCTWTGEIPRDAGYRFPTGTRPFYFSVAQVVDPDPLSPDKGNTAAKKSADKTFSL